MHTETTTKTTEWETTTYSCDQEGCDFTTEHKYDADSHYGSEHAIAEEGSAAGKTFYRFDTKENFDAYVKAHDIPEKFVNWHGEGWYRNYGSDERCPRGCCDDWTQHLDPASWIGFDWEKKIKKMKERLTELQEFLGDDD